MLGLEKEAFSYLNEAIAVTENIKEPFNSVMVSIYTSFTNLIVRRFDTACQSAQKAKALAEKHYFPAIQGVSQYFEGYSLYWLDSKQKGLENMLQGLDLWQKCGSRNSETSYFVGLAEVYIDFGDLAEADKFLNKALVKMNAYGERYYQPEFYRLKAKVLSFTGKLQEAKQLIHKGIDLAQKQSSKILETRLRNDLNVF